jgi:2-haloacid dehalogenase
MISKATLLQKPQLLIFDVNETLLDLSPVKRRVNELRGDVHAFKDWFSLLLHYSCVESISGNYLEFGSIGKATLKMVFQEYQKDIQDKEIEEVLGLMGKLPAHKEVPEALELFRHAGYTLVVLSNGSLDLVQKQLDHAGLSQFFERIFSVGVTNKFKPDPATYTHVLDQMQIPANKGMLLAAHAWDILGAQRVGMQTAFVSRPGKVIYPAGPDPEYSGTTLVNIAQQMIGD